MGDNTNATNTTNTTNPCDLEPSLPLPLLYTEMSFCVFGVVGNAVIFLFLLCVYQVTISRMSERMTLTAVSGLLLTDAFWCLFTFVWCAVCRQAYEDIQNPMNFTLIVLWRVVCLMQVASNYIYVFLTFARYISLCHPLRVAVLLKVRILVACVVAASLLYCVLQVSFGVAQFQSADCVMTYGKQVKGEVARKKGFGLRAPIYLVHLVVFDVLPGAAITVFLLLIAKELKSISSKYTGEERTLIWQFVYLHVFMALKFILFNCLPSISLYVSRSMYLDFHMHSKESHRLIAEISTTFNSVHFSTTSFVILMTLPCLRHQIGLFIQTKVIRNVSKPSNETRDLTNLTLLTTSNTRPQ